MDNDLYETQEETLDLILPFLSKYKNSRILEPCCGNNSIVNYLREKGFENVIGFDLNYGENKQDFLSMNDFSQFDMIITNPPFKNKNLFLKKMYESNLPFFALFPIEILCQDVYTLIQQFGIHVYFLPNKPRFKHNGEIKHYSHHCCFLYYEGNQSGKLTFSYLPKLKIKKVFIKNSNEEFNV